MSDEGGNDRPTLIRPPPNDPDKAPIENALEVLDLSVIGPNIFTNTRPMWHPPGARGVYGGAMIAMCLAAGQKTVPDDFTVHSCHCYFILAGSADIPVLFHVEIVRDGRSYATRTVQARQRGRPIFTTTMSFTKAHAPSSSSSGNNSSLPHEFKDNVIRHAAPMPVDPATGRAIEPPPDDFDAEPDLASAGPFQTSGATVVNSDGLPQTKKTRSWHRARGKISDAGGHQAHLNALAYLSDSYFIGTVTRIHKLWRYPFPPRDFAGMSAEVQQQIVDLSEFEGFDTDGSLRGKGAEAFYEFWKDRPELGMMVSLDHSIYFHEPRKVRADEWMLSEMESPWAGDGRGVVTQKIFSKDGTLLATCFQEGVVRLKAPEPASAKPKL